MGTDTVAARRAAIGGCSERGGDFYLATRGDIELATHGDFFMATDTPSAVGAERIRPRSVGTSIILTNPRQRAQIVDSEFAPSMVR
jgi:hypothetical protein